MNLKFYPLPLFFFVFCFSHSFASPFKTNTDISAPSATPKEGLTDFNSLYHGSFVDLTGIHRADGTGLLAQNVAGYDFRLFGSNTSVDFGIGIEPFTGETALVYGYSQNGNGFTTALEISSDDDKIFDLQSLDITVDNGSNTPPITVQLTGYLKGNPVSGAVLSLSLLPASGGGGLVNFNTTGNPKFIGIDMIRISGSGLYAIGVDNINAINFRINTLPLTLMHFSGSIENNNAVLNWETTNETNTSNFQIERSINTVEYKTAGTVNASNTPGTHHYSFTDKEIATLASPVIYYRLRQSDLDGNFTYSKVIKLSGFNAINNLSVYPNPAHGDGYLYFSLPQPEDVQIKISNQSGKIVKRLAKSLKGTSRISLDLTTLPKGMYYIEVTGNTIQKVFQLIRQ